MKRLLLLAFAIFFITEGALSCNTDKDCSNHGTCTDGDCVCDTGFFKKDCSEDLSKTHKSELIAFQACMGFCYFFIFVFFGIAFFFSMRGNQGLAVVSNIRSIVFGMLSLIGLTIGVFFTLDPYAVWGAGHRITNYLLSTTHYPLGVTVFIAVLFHWVELMNLSLETLKKEHMLQKINAHYKGKDVTLEDVVEKVKFLKKLRIPFVVAICTVWIIYALEIPALILQNVYFLVAEVLLIILHYIVFTIGFIVYGRRLVALMPYELTKKVKKLTFRLTCVSGYILLSLLLIIPMQAAFPPSTPSLSMTRYAVVYLNIFTICLALGAIFLTWDKKFPFVVFSVSSRRSSNYTQGSLERFPSTDIGTDVSEALDDVPL